MGILYGRHILLGVTASVAAYKSCELARMLIKAGAVVRVVMTEHAAELVRPLLFETLTGNKVFMEMFPEMRDDPMEHIGLADWADLFLIAPATANFIGKAASGVADDLISTTFLTVDSPVIIAPAMNSRMWQDPSVQANIELLQERGVGIIGPGTGELACGTSGEGRLANLDTIFDAVVGILNKPGPLSGRKILISAGPTREFIDEVRFISNPSTGRMGFMLAGIASSWGAEVVLVHGPTHIEPPGFVRSIEVISAEEMATAVLNNAPDADIIIMAAAVSDWTLPRIDGKIKKKGRDFQKLELRPTKDILAELGKQKGTKILVGFAVETENMIENAREKMNRKNLDMIFVNNPREAGTTFGAATNAGYLITAHEERKIPLMEKGELARIILKKLENILSKTD